MRIPEAWELHGYLATCRNDAIADISGNVTHGLQTTIRSPAFQALLDPYEAVIMGHRAHLAVPNRPQRTRIILSSHVTALEHKEGGWWWNPAQMPLKNMLQMVAPQGGLVAIHGGQFTQMYFLSLGLATLHIARAESVAIQDGLKMFPSCDRKTTAEMVLRELGLRLKERDLIDLRAPTSLSTWRRR